MFTSEQLEEALFFAYEVFADAQLDFFLMGKTAQKIYNNEFLEGDLIQLGVRNRDLAPSSLELLKISNPNIDISGNWLIMECNGVPIKTRIIKKHYRVLDNLDVVDYAYESFKIPTPFESFMRMSQFMH